MFPDASPGYLELAIFRFEDVCVDVQEEMDGYLKTAALTTKAGIEATFRWLRRRRVAICLLTDYGKEDFLLLTRRLGWGVGEEELIQLVILEEASKPDAVRRACEYAGIRSTRRALVVVDSPRLLRNARSVGISLSVGVTNGHRAYQELAEEPFRDLLDGVIQLPNYLLATLPGEEVSLGGGALSGRPPRLLVPGR